MNFRTVFVVAAVTVLSSACGSTESGPNDPHGQNTGASNGADGGQNPVLDAGQGQTVADAGTPGVTCSPTQSCASGTVCDHDNVCRPWCGSNYPGFVCPSGSACDHDICRPTCDQSGTCAAGTTCQAGFCKPQACDANTACPLREACVAGNCQRIGNLCGNGYYCHQGEDCQQGVCRVRCGPLYPNTYCATGETCQNGACRP